MPRKRTPERKCVASRTDGGVFVTPGGRRVAPAKAVRMHRIGIPQSFTDVCVLGKQHEPLIALATDGKGQRQYFYTWDHRKRSRSEKTKRIARLAAQIGDLRETIRALMNDKGKDVAAEKRRAVGLSFRLMDKLAMRPGKPQYRDNNGTFGATTLDYKKHMTIDGNKVVIKYKGKKGVDRNLTLRDPEFVAAMKRAVNNGKGRYFTGKYAVDVWHPKVMPDDLKIKDLRTLSANAMLIKFAIKDAKQNWHSRNWRKKTHTKPRQRVAELIAKVAKCIGHTFKVCNRNYILWEVRQLAERILVGEKIKGSVNDAISEAVSR